MLQLKNRFLFSSFADRDIAKISWQNKYNASLAPVPIHTLRFIPSVRKKLNGFRHKEVVLQKIPKQRMALFVPYRKRKEHLPIFLKEMDQFLQKKKIDYHIFIIEQRGEDFFNRGALFNLGIKEFGTNFDYFCLHDVDLIPLQADYNCYNQPMRLVSFISKEKMKIPKQLGKGEYNHHFGGVVTISKNIFWQINGFSNLYHHYGFEDDDLFLRLLFKGYIPCKDLSGYYSSLPHPASSMMLPIGKISRNFLQKYKIKNRLKKNKNHFSAIKRELKQPFLEGLTTLKYKVEIIKKEKNYTFCSANLKGSASLNYF